MKIHLGFVSNSSSESFLIYGICLKKEEITEDIEYKIEKLGLSLNYNPDNDWVKYIGKSWELVGPDQTGNQFRKEITDKILSVFGKDLDLSEFGTYTDSWYNG